MPICGVHVGKDRTNCVGEGGKVVEGRFEAGRSSHEHFADSWKELGWHEEPHKARDIQATRNKQDRAGTDTNERRERDDGGMLTRLEAGLWSAALLRIKPTLACRILPLDSYDMQCLQHTPRRIPASAISQTIELDSLLSTSRIVGSIHCLGLSS